MEVIVQILPLAILFAIVFFLVIRPEQQKAKRHREMVASLQKGDKIITSGGVYAEVVKTEDDFIKVKLNDDGVIVKLSRDFVARKQDDSATAA